MPKQLEVHVSSSPASPPHSSTTISIAFHTAHLRDDFSVSRELLSNVRQGQIYKSTQYSDPGVEAGKSTRGGANLSCSLYILIVLDVETI